MVVAIAEVDAGFGMDFGDRVANEFVDHFAVGTDRASQGEELASEFVDTVHLFDADFGDDIEFQGVDEFDDVFEDREVAIDDGIEEAIEEVVQIGVGDFASFLSEALAEGIPAVTGTFLEGDQDVAFEVD